jgi:hypothetical protein
VCRHQRLLEEADMDKGGFLQTTKKKIIKNIKKTKRKKKKEKEKKRETETRVQKAHTSTAEPSTLTGVNWSWL